MASEARGSLCSGFSSNSTGCEGATKEETVVTVLIKDHGKKSELSLSHAGLYAGISADDHLAGWTSSLVHLATDIQHLVCEHHLTPGSANPATKTEAAAGSSASTLINQPKKIAAPRD